MDDLFAIDDDDVQVVSRPVERRRSPSPVRNAAQSPTAPAQQVDAPRARYLGDGDDDEAEEASYDAAAAARRRRGADGEAEFSLGLDEEVVIKKKRVVARLDEERLLEPHHGLPKLIKLSLERPLHRTLRGGKNNTLQDMGKVLERYQFWCHEMFPKAKFRDALAMVRKAGSSKRMKVERRRFINDLLPKPIETTADDPDEDNYGMDEDYMKDEPMPESKPQMDVKPAFEDEDEDLDALFAAAAAQAEEGLPGYSAVRIRRPSLIADDEDDEDALEAMYS